MLATGTGRPGPEGLVGQDKKTGVEIARFHQENVKKARNIVIVGGGAYGVREFMNYSYLPSIRYPKLSPRTRYRPQDTRADSI